MKLRHRNHLINMACATSATTLGLGYLTLGGAPARYVIVNGLALAVGLVLASIVVRPKVRGVLVSDFALIAMGTVLLATAFLGSSLDGATRWINVGGLVLQPSLILIPAMVMAYAVTSQRLSTVGMVIAAMALAWQPDRAMAGALAVGLGAIFSARRDLPVGLALAAALLGFAVTLVRPDALPGMPFVEQVYATAFGVSASAGMAVWIGTILLLVPAIHGWFGVPEGRPLYLTFGATWLAIMVAAGMGNYPTPVVAYGSSSILGYLVSLALLGGQKAQTADRA